MDDCQNPDCKHEKYAHQDNIGSGEEPFSGKCLMKEDSCKCKKFVKNGEGEKHE